MLRDMEAPETFAGVFLTTIMHVSIFSLIPLGETQSLISDLHTVFLGSSGPGAMEAKGQLFLRGSLVFCCPLDMLLCAGSEVTALIVSQPSTCHSTRQRWTPTFPPLHRLVI